MNVQQEQKYKKKIQIIKMKWFEMFIIQNTKYEQSTYINIIGIINDFSQLNPPASAHQKVGQVQNNTFSEKQNLCFMN